MAFDENENGKGIAVHLVFDSQQYEPFHYLVKDIDVANVYYVSVVRKAFYSLCHVC